VTEFIMYRLTFAIVLAATLFVSPAFANGESAKPHVSNPDEVFKCRKVEVTGSLLKKGKVCRSIAEWKRIQSNGNRTARAIAESGNVCSGGCCGNGVGCSGGQ
jgi:hypothetical protein